MAQIFYAGTNGSDAVQRLFCAATDPITLADLEEIGDALFDVFNAQIWPNMANDWQATGIRVRAMNEAEGLLFDDTNAYPVTGGVDGPVPAAAQVSYTTTLNTGLSGRSARGRVYGVGLPPGGYNLNRLTDAEQAELQSEWELVLTAMETAGHALQVVSFETGGVPRTEGRPLPVISVNVRFPLATQRRRV